MNEIDVFEIENILIYMVWTWWIYVVGTYYYHHLSQYMYIVWLYLSGHQHHQLYVLYVSQPVLIICQLDFLGSSCQNLALYLETRPALLAAHRSNAGGFGICKKMDISCFVFLLCFPPLSIYIERKERRKEESKTCNYVVQSVQDGSGTF